MEEGTGQLILTQTYNSSDTAFDESGDPGFPVDFEKWEISAYGEYGVTERVTAYSRAALQDVSLSLPSGSDEARGLAATEIGARYRLFERGAGVMSIQAAALLPGQGENVSDLGFGDGDGGFDLRLLAGRGFEWKGRHGFLDAQAAYRGWSGGTPDEARLDLTAGLDATERLQVIGQAFGLASLGETLPDREYYSLKGQLSAVYWFSERRGFQVGALGTLAGQSIVQERAVFAGYWLRF